MQAVLRKHSSVASLFFAFWLRTGRSCNVLNCRPLECQTLHEILVLDCRQGQLHSNSHRVRHDTHGGAAAHAAFVFVLIAVAGKRI